VLCRVESETSQLLEAIGVVPKKDGDKAAACGSNYQDEVSLRTEDYDETCDDNENCEENVLEAVSKVRFKFMGVQVNLIDLILLAS
jgi:hypothetical protein